MGKLNNTFLKSIRPNGKMSKYADGNGLTLVVSKAGSMTWLVRYRKNGKEQTFTLGQYPHITLQDARKKLCDIQSMLSQNIDPVDQKNAEKRATKLSNEVSFETIALEWHDKQKNIWSENHAITTLNRLNNHVFPHLGNKPISTINPPQLLEVLRRIEVKGTHETAHRVKSIVGQIFQYAIATGRAERNIAVDLNGALTPVKANHYASIIEPKEVSILLRNIDESSSGVVVKTFLQIIPYLFVRPGELRAATWNEFDFDTATWTIPAERMKMKEKHIVALAPQVIDKLNNLKKYTGHTQYLFPSPRSKTRPITPNALLNALRAMGYEQDQMSIHGFRHMASTLLNEQGYNFDWIEKQLAHGERNKVRGTYNYAKHLNDRRRMMLEWANYLDKLKGENQ